MKIVRLQNQTFHIYNHIWSYSTTGMGYLAFSYRHHYASSEFSDFPVRSLHNTIIHRLTCHSNITHLWNTNGERNYLGIRCQYKTLECEMSYSLLITKFWQVPDMHLSNFNAPQSAPYKLLHLRFSAATTWKHAKGIQDEIRAFVKSITIRQEQNAHYHHWYLLQSVCTSQIQIVPITPLHNI